jgi:hypothetical protein
MCSFLEAVPRLIIRYLLKPVFRLLPRLVVVLAAAAAAAIDPPLLPPPP